MDPDARPRHSILERIGGPWALSWQVGVLAYVPAVLAALFDAARHGGSPLVWIACGVAASTVLFVALIPVRRWVLPGSPRYRRPRPLVALGVFAAAGAARGTLLAALAVQFDLQASYEWGFRQIAGAAIATTMLVTITLVVDAVATYRAGVRRLAAEEAQVAAIERAAEAHRDEVLREVRARLLDRLHAHLDGGARSEAIDAAIDDLVHPLVDELGTDVELRTPVDAALPDARVGWRELVTGTLWIAPFHPVAVALALGGLMVAYLAYRFGIVIAVPLTAAFCAANALPLLAARAVAGRSERRRGRADARIALITITHAAMLALTVGVGLVATTGGPVAELSGSTVAVAVAIIFVSATSVNAVAASVSAAVALSAIAARDLRAATDARAWTSARAEEAVRALRSSLAAIVHGPVQSALIRAAAALEQPDAGTDAIPQARAEIDEALARGANTGAQEIRLGAALDAIVSVWTGVAAIRIHADATLLTRLDRDAVGAGTILEIVREGVSNAVRHAGAREVDVDVTLDGALATVIVRSDARRGESTARRGLGTDMLDRVCTSWDRTVDTTGTRLIAHVPVDVTSARTAPQPQPRTTPATD